MPTSMHDIGLRCSQAFAAGLLALLAGCSSAPHGKQTPGPVTSPRLSPATSSPHQLVVLGDSIADTRTYNCVGCTNFTNQFAGALGSALGAHVNVVNLAVPDAQVANLLHSIRTDEVYRSAITDSDAVLVNIGHNDLAYNRLDDPCDVAPNYPKVAWRQITHACLDRALAQYRSDLDQVFTLIERLRDGKPTLIRITTVYNSVIGDRVDPTWNSPAAIPLRLTRCGTWSRCSAR